MLTFLLASDTTLVPAALCTPPKIQKRLSTIKIDEAVQVRSHIVCLTDAPARLVAEPSTLFD